MNPVLSTVLEVSMLWYALPLVVAVSLVYAATRHEAMGPILHHAVRVGAYIVSFMFVVFAVFWLLSLWV
jgi:hypothetical protein